MGLCSYFGGKGYIDKDDDMNHKSKIWLSQNIHDRDIFVILRCFDVYRISLRI